MNKLKAIIYWLGRILFIFCLVIFLLNIVLNTKIYIDYRIIFWSIYSISLLIFTYTSKRKIYVAISGVVPLFIFSYHILNVDNTIEIRKKIEQSEYEILINSNGYKLIKKVFFLEKEVAKKESKIFFSPYSKIGIVNSFDVDAKIIEENNDMIILEISTIRHMKKDS